MTKFINRQEEVLQIQLTPYGKYLFSQGKFSPEYYSFYDDDILYDGLCAGIIETQNQIVDRIKSTERLELFCDFSGSVRNNQTNSNISKDSFSRLTDANGKFFRCLGSNSPWSDYAPAWSVAVMEDSALFTDTSGQFVTYESEKSIPVINSTLEMNYSGSIEDIIYGGEVTPFTSYAVIKEDKILLDIQELNTIFKVGGNYDIEIFKIPRNINGSLETKSLEFIDPNSPNYDSLVDQISQPYFTSYMQTDVSLNTMFPIINSDYVEYYLSVRVDDEITDVPDFRSGLYSTNRPNNPQDPCD